MNNDRVVIITGSGKGLGAAFARQIAADGGKVIVNNRIRDGQPDSAGMIVSEIEAVGGVAVANRLDVTEPGASDAIVEQALSEFGQLDAVVFNAGINGDAARFTDMAPGVFDEVMNINFTAPVALARAAWPHLQENGSGRMLFISSSAGLYGVRGRAPYAASKGALNAFAATLAHEGRRFGLGINVLMPYATTQMTAGVGSAEQADLLASEKVAPLASWLVSTACETGGEIWAAGGGYARKAKILETEGAFLASDVDRWARENEAALENVGGNLQFKGAEAAFEDLLRQLT